jgi:hypothetical protein
MPKTCKIERAPDFTGWRAYWGDAYLGKFPSYHVAQVACEIAAAVEG